MIVAQMGQNCQELSELSDFIALRKSSALINCETFDEWCFMSFYHPDKTRYLSFFSRKLTQAQTLEPEQSISRQTHNAEQHGAHGSQSGSFGSSGGSCQPAAAGVGAAAGQRQPGWAPDEPDRQLLAPDYDPRGNPVPILLYRRGRELQAH